LDLPCGGQCQDAIRTKVFENYIRDHVHSWFDFAQRDPEMDVERMEDIILVSGCTLVTSWAAATFYDNTQDVKISLKSKALDNGLAEFQWGPEIVNIDGVAHHDGPVGSVGFLELIDTTCADLFIRIGIPLRINACSLEDFEQNGLYSTSPFGVQQSPFPMTLIANESTMYR
jgi:hypothetical protein